MSTFSDAVFLVADSRTRRAALRAISSIMKNFFGLQTRAHWARILRLPGAIPVTNVDHPLDETIPFVPRYVAAYHDFSGLWIRTAALMFRAPKDAARVNDFINGIAELYVRAAEVYRVNMSTTTRPTYLKSARFILIYLADPHLLCIPSLHIMVMVYVAVKARRFFGAESAEYAAIYNRALEISDSVLYIKQHSVNCIAAALYAMTAMLGAEFNREEAARYAAALFTRTAADAPQNADEIRRYIIALYTSFCDAADTNTHVWEAPLLEYLRTRCNAPLYAAVS